MKRLALVLLALMLSSAAFTQSAAGAGGQADRMTDTGIAYTRNRDPGHDAVLGITNRGSLAASEFWTKGPHLYGHLGYAEITPTGIVNWFFMSQLTGFGCSGPDWFFKGVASILGYGYFNGRPSIIHMMAFDAWRGALNMLWVQVFHMNGALIYERVVAVLDGDVRVLPGNDD